MKKENTTPTKEEMTHRVYIREKDAINGWAIYNTDGSECALGFLSEKEAVYHAEEMNWEIIADKIPSNLKHPTPTKEGLHTPEQKAQEYKLHQRDLDNLVAELRKSNLRQFTCLNDWGYSQSERNIVDAITAPYKNERKALLDSNRELLETLKELHSYAKQFKAYNTIQNSTHFHVANIIANGLHNKFK